METLRTFSSKNLGTTHSISLNTVVHLKPLNAIDFDCLKHANLTILRSVFFFCKILKKNVQYLLNSSHH